MNAVEVMSEKLPYEQQLNQAWDRLPLPDEDMAWKDMKRRLDEDNDDKIVVPPPKTGCGINAILIGLLLVGGFWVLVRPEKWFTSKETETTQQPKENDKKNDVDNRREDTLTGKLNDAYSNGNKTVTSEDTGAVRTKDKAGLSSLQKEKINEVSGESKIDIANLNSISKKTKPSGINETRKADKPVSSKGNEIAVKDKKVKNVKDDIGSTRQERNIPVNKTVADSGLKNKVDGIKNENDSVAIEPDTFLIRTDTAIVKPVDSVASKKPDQPVTRTDTSTEKKKDKHLIFFSAGIGLHQQIPITGQEWTTYGSLGRKGILSDYIPSINFRMEKQNRWFLQTEFRYGAPQHTKQITYNQKISIDTQTQIVTTNSTVLKKTFYHQVPLTFNYYILPNWSIGTGIQWNKFYSAVAEQALSRRSPGSADSVISKNIISVRQDSAGEFVKSWTQGILQSQYQWKRFSIGVRYSFGLEPYIKFTLPGQPTQEEKNSSLQFFLRYELWRSKKK